MVAGSFAMEIRRWCKEVSTCSIRTTWVERIAVMKNPLTGYAFKNNAQDADRGLRRRGRCDNSHWIVRDVLTSKDAARKKLFTY